MSPGPSRLPARAGGNSVVTIDEPAWRRIVRNPEILVMRAARAAASGASPAAVGTDPAAAISVVLTGDATVKRLNSRHRGRNKPTNVLTFDHGREILLAYGTVRREAEQAQRRPAHHLAHLVVHGALHLQGHDHHHPGDARRMEMAETRILARIGLPNPWRRA